jgi:hypothetical protein
MLLAGLVFIFNASALWILVMSAQFVACFALASNEAHGDAKLFQVQNLRVDKNWQ